MLPTFFSTFSLDRTSVDRTLLSLRVRIGSEAQVASCKLQLYISGGNGFLSVATAMTERPEYSFLTAEFNYMPPHDRTS